MNERDDAQSHVDEPPVQDPPRVHPIAGEVVSVTLPYDGGRTVAAYLPPEPAEAVVYAADGQLISQWGGYLEAAAGVPATAIVGVHATDDIDEMARISEYSPRFDPERFEAHERFFVQDVRDWARDELGIVAPADRTAVYGVSAGAELALALGIRHPDVYGAILAASPGGGYQPPPTLPGPLPRTYLVAGTREPWFAGNATRWATALSDAGADVVMLERAGDHGDPFWQAEFPRMVAWACRGDVAG
ncbi:alpha/beta hydrolase [Pseudactinotalea sp.]|uniref:alpha/beta hydrolase n=1 Tax=Pseudactinotalea sp. TaxID=1926260 RepID=UPI003B3AE021